MRITLFIILTLFLLSGADIASYAQGKGPLRVELNANLEMEDYNFVPCGKNGVFVFFESNKAGTIKDTRIWNFAMYDHNLKQQWVADTALIHGVKFLGHAANDRYTYLFFIDRDKLRSEYNMQVLRLDYGVNHFSIINATIPLKSEPAGFSIRDMQAVIPLNNDEFEPNILFLDLLGGGLKIVKPELDGLNIIHQAVFDEAERHWYFILENYLGKRQNTLMALQTSLGGEVLRNYRINPAIENKVLNNARIASLEGDTLLLIGTYHNEAAKLKANSDEDDIASAGYFICRFEGEVQTLINYYNFLEFEELYRSLSSKTIAEIRRKAERKKNKGEEYSVDYTLLLHDIIPFGENYVIFSEAYYPEYRTVTNMYYDYYGRPIPQTYTVFDGYKYISGIVACFNDAGELIWDNGIEIVNIITFNLDKYLGYYSNGEEMALFYNNQNKINYKMMGEEENSGPLQNIELVKRYKGDKLMEDLGSRMIHWYDNYFICYGYQKIKNNRVSGGKRTIFYFSKLAFN